MENKAKNNKKVILGIAALAVVIVLLAVLYSVFREKPVEGSKAITIEVSDQDAEKTSYELKTDAEYLRQAMEEADGAHWSFYVNGEYCNYGIDTQPVADGDVFSIVYTKE